jgi:hypothetical protein
VVVGFRVLDEGTVGEQNLVEVCVEHRTHVSVYACVSNDPREGIDCSGLGN